jgi:hypothetical protein
MSGECIESGESGWRMSGECVESGEKGWRMSGEFIESGPNLPKWPFWRVLAFAKLANFRRVLEFDKFAGEWPLLSFNLCYFSPNKRIISWKFC